MLTVISKSGSTFTKNYSRRAVKNGYLVSRANDVDSLNVKHWARESIAILIDNLTMAPRVHQDFSPMVQQAGDTVNTRQAAEFSTIRKTFNDDVTVQNATTTNVPVRLNQNVHVSFLIRDGEESLSFQDLTSLFMEPAMISQAEFLDSVLCLQAYQFLQNSGGRLGQMDETNGKSYLLETRKVMNDNKAYGAGRNMILNTSADATLLDIQQFTDAQSVGDGGSTLASGMLRPKLGFNFAMSQNMPFINPMNSLVTGAINNAAGYPATTTSLTVDGLSAAITAGTYFTVAGDNTPQQVVSTTGGSTPTAIVCSPGLRRAVADNAVITLYPKSTVSATYTYDSNTNTGHQKAIAINAFSGNTPQVGQLVSFGSSLTKYAIVRVDSTTSIWLDRPLEATVTSGDTINLGPNGGYNFAFHRNALTLVSRPLAKPKTGTGALSEVVSVNNMSMRVVITYDGNKQGHLVTLDGLFGVKVLDTDLGAVMYN